MLRKTAGSTIVIASFLLVSTILSILAGDGTNLPFCSINPANAQDTPPCLAQEVTISAQEVQILELQLTNNAQQNQLLQVNATLSAIDNTSPIIITVPVIITATLDYTPTPPMPQVEIVHVVGIGNHRSEGVEIRNTSGVVELTGWTLEDSDGNMFTFPTQRLFTNGLISVYTRPGSDTPIALYWGLSEAVFDESDTVTLKDRNGNIQGTLSLSE